MCQLYFDSTDQNINSCSFETIYIFAFSWYFFLKVWAFPSLIFTFIYHKFSQNSIFSCCHLSSCHVAIYTLLKIPLIWNSPIPRARMTISTREHRRPLTYINPMSNNLVHAVPLQCMCLLSMIFCLTLFTNLMNYIGSMYLVEFLPKLLNNNF